jgi:hypothetical protein
MIGITDKGQDREHCYIPHFWGNLGDLGTICKSVFNFDIFWKIYDPEIAKIRTDAMVKFIEQNNILIPEPPPKDILAERGRFSLNGKTYKLEEIK